MIEEQLLDSLSKVEINFDEDKLYLIIFRKSDWEQLDMRTIATHLNQIRPKSTKILTIETESGKLDIEAYTKQELIDLIKRLIDKL